METSNVIQDLTKEMEESFKAAGLVEQLHDLIDKALGLTDDQVKGALAVMKSPLVVVTGRVKNVFKIPEADGKVNPFIDAARLQDHIQYDPDAPYGEGVPIYMWRRVVELEALNREIADVDLSRVLSVISNKASEIEPDADEEPLEDGPPPIIPPKEAPKEGYTAKNAPPEICKKVVALRDSGMPFHKIEKELGLRQVRGMTAHRIYNKVKQTRK